MTGMSKRAAARIGGILAGAGVVFVGAALIASAPAFADNGPHVTNMGTSAIGSGPDGCAGCHRLHTATGAAFLFRSATTETQLCENCHGTAGTGASTDVMDGWSYSGSNAVNSVAPLRAGGFEKAGIVGDSTTRTALADPLSDRLITKAGNSISGTKTTTAVTSSHAVEVAGTMWGYGTTNTGATNVALECTSCHNPHGNGNYRILRPVAYAGMTTDATPVAQTAVTNNYFVAPVAVSSASAVPYNDAEGAARFNYVYVTATPHGLRPGQSVAINGPTLANGGLVAAYVTSGTVTEVTDATHFSIGAKTTTGMVNPGASSGTAYVSQAWPQNIKSVSVNAGARTVTYTTFAAHGLTAPLVGGATGTTAVGQTKQNTQFVTITGVQSPAADYNLAQVPVTAVPTASSFTVTVPAGMTMPSSTYTIGFSGGYILGIPDSLNKAALGTTVYQQDNFWRADDHYYTGVQANTLGTNLVAVTAASGSASSATYTVSSTANLAVGDLVTITGLYNDPLPALPTSATSSGFNQTGARITAIGANSFTAAIACSSNCVLATGTNQSAQQSGYLSPKTASAFINNVSQWCSTCHTRYLAASNSRMLPNTTAAGVDSVFTYRHTSNSAGEDSPNCIQCHVAHGSDAQMSNVAGQPNYSYNLNNPGDPKTATTDKGTATAGDSRLLRADNRGVCLLCHNV